MGWFKKPREVAIPELGDWYTVRANDDVGLRFAEGFAQRMREYHEREREWVREMQEAGVKAAHPDDGWVDRARNTVHFCYPQFDFGPTVGDRIVLGGHDKHRIVRVTAVNRRPSLIAGGEWVDYSFAEAADKEGED